MLYLLHYSHLSASHTVLFIPFSHLCSTSPLPILSHLQSVPQMLEIPCFFPFCFVSPLPSVPLSKMGESECFNYYNIHAYVHLQAILLPASRLHLVSIILHLVQFRVFFLPCHSLLHSVLNTCTPSTPYSSTPSLSFTYSAPPPTHPYFSPTPAFRLKWATRLIMLKIL